MSWRRETPYSSQKRPFPARRPLRADAFGAEKGKTMFCNGCNNNSLWVLILIIILFGCGNGCGSNCGGCGCDNNCGCNSGCGCN